MPLALDTETWLIRPGLLAPPLVCTSLSDGRMFLEAEILPVIKELLASGEILIGHNIAYDFTVLAVAMPELIPGIFEHYRKGLVRDTQIRQELLDIAAGRRPAQHSKKDGDESRQFLVFRNGAWETVNYSLAGLAKIYLGKDRFSEKLSKDSWRLKYHELAKVPMEKWPEEAINYAKEDALDTYDIWEKQGPELLVNEKEQVYSAFCLHLMSTWGIRTKEDSVVRLEATLLEKQAKARKRVIQAGFLELTRASKDQVEKGNVDFWAPDKKGELKAFRYKQNKKLIQMYTERVYKRKKLSIKYTDKGGISTDRDCLTQSGSLLLAAVSEGGGIDKILNTYIPVLKQGTQLPINARFHVLVNSGRTSSSNPNLQNLPSGRIVGGTRECVTPRPGYVFISCDYETFELRAWAQVKLWLFGRSKMAETLQQGKDDLHAAMAAQILGVPYEQVIKNKKVKGSPEKNARDLAKIANFGFPGGLGAASFVDYARANGGLKLTIQKSQELRDQWLKTWPEAKLYLNHISMKVGIDYANFTQFVSNRIRGAVGYCDGCNTYFQGLAADAFKAAMCQVMYECFVDEDSWLYGARPVVPVHDELIIEAPVEVAHEAAVRLSEAMCEAAKVFIPDIPLKAEPALMPLWYKDAEPVIVDGRYVPWEPKK